MCNRLSGNNISLISFVSFIFVARDFEIYILKLSHLLSYS